MSAKDHVQLGQLITGEAHRDCIHIAVAPMVAQENLNPGDDVDAHGVFATGSRERAVGVVDPFLKSTVKKGQQFYCLLYPGTITRLRHEWSHPAFKDEGMPQVVEKDRAAAIAWMAKWAKRHSHADDEDSYGRITLARAIDFGHDMSVGECEDARDDIDQEWWDNWETITGERAGEKRSGYFSCSC
jgi:hypothetical protein